MSTMNLCRSKLLILLAQVVWRGILCGWEESATTSNLFLGESWRSDIAVKFFRQLCAPASGGGDLRMRHDLGCFGWINWSRESSLGYLASSGCLLTKEDEEVVVASTCSPAAAPVVLEVRKMPGLRLNEKQEVVSSYSKRHVVHCWEKDMSFSADY